MQMNEQVLTALEVLRNFAENDFELHRIDVLEKDLTAPPVAEQIDGTHQKFNGVIYKRNSGGHYLNFNLIHRDIWIYYNGEIPTDDTYEIHHKNENKADNDISNLQLLTKSEHHKLHILNSPQRKMVCEVCGEIFYSNSIKRTVRCCSKKCTQRLRYVKKHEIRNCAFCGKEFWVYKNSKTNCCSQSCAKKLHHQTTPKTEKICSICGNKFYTEVGNKLYCSKNCARIARRYYKNKTKK